MSETATIPEIQGAAHVSPLVGRSVLTGGVVTAVDSNGFYLQDPAGDGDDATSDAVFVFTGGQPAVAVGDALTLRGTVSEFVPGGAASLAVMMYSGEPTSSAAVTTSCRHSGCTSTRTAGMRARTSFTLSRVKRPCTEQ